MAPTPKWQLAIEDDEGHTTTLDLSQGDYTVGRGEDNDVRLTERNISRRHATFQRSSKGWQVVDHGSYNGTFYNGERLHQDDPVVLNPGDIVNLGDYRIELVDAAVTVVEEEPQKSRRPDRLVVVIGPQPGVEFSLLDERLMVGRAEDATISINHASVSRHHAEIVSLSQGRWEVVDQGSSNGIRINGVELRRGIIEPGDALELGDVRLRFVAAGKHFRPVVDLSQQLPALPFEGMTRNGSQAPGSSAGRSVGTIAAVLGLLGVLAVVGFAVMVGGEEADTNAPDDGMAQSEDEARRFLDRARAEADNGDIAAAHGILQKIPETSPVRDDPAYRGLEDRWADHIFDEAEKTDDVEEKRKLFLSVADATTVSAEKRRVAADKAFELAPEDEKKKQRPDYRPPPGYTPPPRPKTSPGDIYEQPDAKVQPPKKEPVPPKFNESAEKRRLMNKMGSGAASVAELTMLKAICMNDGDRACRDAAVAALNAKKKKK